MKPNSVHAQNEEDESKKPEMTSCNFCSFKAPHSTFLLDHIKSVHDEELSAIILKDQSKPYSCNQCQYKSKWKKDLQKHQDSKHNGLKYCCSQCTYQVKTKDALKAHIEFEHD